jgi:hypothetical protein
VQDLQQADSESRGLWASAQGDKHMQQRSNSCNMRGADADRLVRHMLCRWYPVAPVEDLDPAKPHPFTLLNLPLVLWADKAGTWHAFADRCPHRCAP